MVVCLETFPIAEYVDAVIHMSRPHLVEVGGSWRLVFVEADEERARQLAAADDVLRVFRVWDREQVKMIERALTQKN